MTGERSFFLKKRNGIVTGGGQIKKVFVTWFMDGLRMKKKKKEEEMICEELKELFRKNRSETIYFKIRWIKNYFYE